MASAITVEQVADWIKISSDDSHLPGVVEAVNQLVTDWHGATWPPGADRGAIMLAARVHRRRNSPGGVETYGDAGNVYVPRWDADLDRLLRIGDYRIPAVG